jgi:hypothetical protein
MHSIIAMFGWLSCQAAHDAAFAVARDQLAGRVRAGGRAPALRRTARTSSSSAGIMLCLTHASPLVGTSVLERVRASLLYLIFSSCLQLLE